MHLLLVTCITTAPGVTAAGQALEGPARVAQWFSLARSPPGQAARAALPLGRPALPFQGPLSGSGAAFTTGAQLLGSSLLVKLTLTAPSVQWMPPRVSGHWETSVF